MQDLRLMDLPGSPACARNRDPILAVLREQFAGPGRVLEIGSGTGEHAAYFSRALAHLTWQTSDLPANHDAIRTRLQLEGGANCLAPIAFDVGADSWPEGRFDFIFTANTCHIMGWPDVVAMFGKFGAALEPGARVCIYGPFNYGGQFTSDSNAAFDRSLRLRDAKMGIRDFEATNSLARAAGLQLQRDIAMPANNRMLAWQRV